MHRELKTCEHKVFFVKDRVDKGEIKVEYCPTNIMLADFFTKPLQGRLFKDFRDVIMGYRTMKEISAAYFESRSVLEK